MHSASRVNAPLSGRDYALLRNIHARSCVTRALKIYRWPPALSLAAVTLLTALLYCATHACRIASFNKLGQELLMRSILRESGRTTRSSSYSSDVTSEGQLSKKKKKKTDDAYSRRIETEIRLIIVQCDRYDLNLFIIRFELRSVYSVRVFFRPLSTSSSILGAICFFPF